jgi:hypothetical protein
MADDPRSVEGLHRTAALVWHSTDFLLRVGSRLRPVRMRCFFAGRKERVLESMWRLTRNCSWMRWVTARTGHSRVIAASRLVPFVNSNPLTLAKGARPACGRTYSHSCTTTQHRDGSVEPMFHLADQQRSKFTLKVIVGPTTFPIGHRLQLLRFCGQGTAEAAAQRLILGEHLCRFAVSRSRCDPVSTHGLCIG